MPNELTISSAQPTAATGDSPPVTKTTSVPTIPAPAQALANPSLRLEAALGLVVIEFRNDTGTVTHSIPSQRQLDAYRQHEETLPRPDGNPTHAPPVAR